MTLDKVLKLLVLLFFPFLFNLPVRRAGIEPRAFTLSCILSPFWKKNHRFLLIYFTLERWSCYVAQASFKIPDSSNLPASVPQVACMSSRSVPLVRIMCIQQSILHTVLVFELLFLNSFILFYCFVLFCSVFWGRDQLNSLVPVGLELVAILLSHLPEFWNYKYASTWPV